MNGMIPETKEEWDELMRLQSQPYDSKKAFEEFTKSFVVSGDLTQKQYDQIKNPCK